MTRQLELCALAADESVAVVTRPDEPDSIAEIVVIATERLAGRPVEIVAHPGATDNPVIRAALDAADLVIDCSGAAAPLVSSETTRVLVVAGVHLHDLDGLAPHPGLARRVESALELLDGAGSLRITSAAGTSVTVNLGGADVIGHRGAAAATGEVASWPQGSLAITPAAETVGGTLVLMPGDILVDFGRFVRSPVRIEIEKDHVAEIIGDSADADLLRSHLEAMATTAAYGMATISLGMIAPPPGPVSTFDPELLGVGDGPLRGGVVGLATGTNPIAGRTSPGGVTIALRGATVAIDGVDLACAGVLEGKLAPDIYERVGRS